MKNSIEKLMRATKNINVFYALAFDEKGNPGAGIRAVDPVITDDIVWLIAGEVTHRQSGKDLMNMNDLDTTVINDMKVSLRAQAVVNGAIVQVDLGDRKVVGRIRSQGDIGARSYLKLEL